MIGTITNAATILTGSVIGSVVKKGIKEEYQGALFDAMGLAAAAVGINSLVSNMPDSQYPVLFIVSLAIGSLVGTVLDIDGRFKRLTGKFSKSNLGEGLATAILLFCIGTLSILGPIESALNNNHTLLFTNATLDFVSSMVRGLHLRHRDCLRGGGAVRVAGGHLYGSGAALAVSVGRASDGNLHHRRDSDRHLGTLDS